EDFTAYADVCFREFGDRVKHWNTMDEPYIVSHNSIILAHAAVVKLYREKYQSAQKGIVGMNIYSFWTYPFSTIPADVAATQRSLDSTIAWIVNPLVYGDYPEIMKRIVGSRLPKFTRQQSEMIRGTAGFIAINHYTSVYISDRSNSVDTAGPRDYNADVAANFRFYRSDPPTGQLIPINMPSDPQGLQCMLEYLSDTYANVPVYVQENGKSPSTEVYCNPFDRYCCKLCYGAFFDDWTYDHVRVEYLSGYIGSALAALRNGANVKGYFVWSFVDVFELLAGYYSRYGIYRVDFQDPNLPREPRLSAQWYSNS
ncbi:hypothetical protein U9M48_043709, partial [Paspalum notatum var. saurae]